MSDMSVVSYFHAKIAEGEAKGEAKGALKKAADNLLSLLKARSGFAV